MLDNIEFVLKVLFLVLSIIWVGRILILRTDKQIVINPLLITISAILVVLADTDGNLEFLGISIQSIKVTLYCMYIIVTIFGIYCTSKEHSVF